MFLATVIRADEVILMNYRLNTVLAATLSFVMVMLAPLPVAGQSDGDTPMLTPDGQPHISGIFTGNVAGCGRCLSLLLIVL